MKSRILKLIVPCTASLICLAGCGHQHTYDSGWSTNNDQHWHDATCEHKGQVCSDLGNHADNDGDGLCDTCGFQLSHIHTPDYEWHTDGSRHWHICSTCGEKCDFYWHEDSDENSFCDYCGYELEYNPDIGTYYDNYDIELFGADLEHELQKICFETHTVYVKYRQYADYASFTSTHISSEAAPSTVGTSNQRNEFFYTGKIQSGVGTREHVWPCANSANLWVHDAGAGAHYVDGNNYAGGGSDLYHIRPSTSSVNTARGNSKFCDFDDPEFADLTNIAEVGDGGPYKLKIEGYEKSGSTYSFANKAEVADEFKGDIARILVYVWIHYAYRGNYYNHEEMLAPGLSLTNVLAYGDAARTYEKLCEWNLMDPPSETEILRNKTVQKMQGNRNPFVDYPVLMNNLFGF